MGANSEDEEAGRVEEEPSLSVCRRVIIATILSASSLLNNITVQCAVILIPSIARDYDIPQSRQQWVTSAYNVSVGCCMLLFGRLADIFPPKMVFLAGCTALTLTTMTAPFMPNEVAFEVLRALQGLSASAMIPSALGLLMAIFPPGPARNHAVTAYGAAASCGSVLGNIMGGFVAVALSWHWVFWLLAIIGGIVTLAGVFGVPSVAAGRQRADSAAKGLGVDWIGAALITGSLVMLLFGMTEGSILSWSVPWVPCLVAASLVVLVGFYMWQRYLERHRTVLSPPLIKVSIFSNSRLPAILGSVACFFASFNGYLVFVTYFYQDYLKLSVSDTTLRFLPIGVSGLLGLFIVGKILSTFSHLNVAVIAGIGGMIMPLLFAVPIPTETTYWAYGFPAMCLGISGDVLSAAAILFTGKSLPPEDQSLGGALVFTSNQLGRAIGLAIATAVQTSVTGSENLQAFNSSGKEGGHFLEGLRAAQGFNAGLTALSVVLVIVAYR